MDTELILRIADGTTNKKDAEEILYDICDSVHSSCDSDCPVYEKNGGVPWVNGESGGDCRTFRYGSKMLHYIQTGEFI